MYRILLKARFLSENVCSEMKPHLVIDIRSKDRLLLPVVLDSPSQKSFLQLPLPLTHPQLLPA